MRRLLAATTAVALAAVTLTAAGPALAASSTKLVHAKYKVSGSTFLKAPDFTLSLGPGTLSSALNPGNGKLTATLSLPPATGSFKQFGIIPVTATTNFINDGKTTGQVNLNTGAVTTTSNITLQITSLIVAGISVPVGTACETKAPVVIKLASEKGFNVLDGGSLTGSYAIGLFRHCLLATPLINLTIPASGNTITLTLGKAKISK